MAILLCFFFACCEGGADKAYVPLNPDIITGFEKKDVPGGEKFDEYGNRNGEWSYVSSNGKHELEWVIYKSLDGQLEFSLPSAWHIEDKKDPVLFSSVGGSEGDYFVVFAHDKSRSQATLDGYLGYVLEEVRKDTLEEVVSSEVEKQTLDDRVAYFASFETRRDSVTYESFSCYSEDEENIFDFSLKFRKSEEGILDRAMFDLVVGSFVVNGKKLFTNKNGRRTIESIEIGVD